MCFSHAQSLLSQLTNLSQGPTLSPPKFPVPQDLCPPNPLLLASGYTFVFAAQENASVVLV